KTLPPRYLGGYGFCEDSRIDPASRPRWVDHAWPADGSHRQASDACCNPTVAVRLNLRREWPVISFVFLSVAWHSERVRRSTGPGRWRLVGLTGGRGGVQSGSGLSIQW